MNRPSLIVFAVSGHGIHECGTVYGANKSKEGRASIFISLLDPYCATLVTNVHQ